MSSNEREVSSSLRMKALTEIRLFRKRKRQEINIAKLSSIKKRKHEEPRAGATNTMRRITDVNLVIRELKNRCRKFSAWKNFSCCMSVKLSPSSEFQTFLAAFRIVLGVAHLSHISANDNMKASRFIVTIMV